MVGDGYRKSKSQKHFICTKIESHIDVHFTVEQVVW